MRFDDTDIEELAAFFSRRFPQPDQRQHMASSAGLSGASGDWAGLLRQAQSAGRLPRLARVTAASAPEDDNLREVCAILTAPQRRRQTVLVVSSAVALGLAVVLGLALTGSRSADAVAAPEPAAVLASAETPPPQTVVVHLPEEPPAEVVPVAAPPAEAPPAEAPPEEPPAPASAPLTGRCQAAEGALIGYWYAGASAPGSEGSAIEIPMAVNVRADYPDAHNNFNARADIRCVLHQGDRLVLSGDPIRVPGARYWVPLYGGDLPE